jgi:hypothetical protein
MATRRALTAGEWTVLAGAVALLIASFLPWYSLPRNVVLDSEVHQRTFSAWSRGYSPLALLPMVIGLAVATPIVLARLADIHLPPSLVTLTTRQLRSVLAFTGVVLTVGEALTGRWYGPVALHRGIGLWASVTGSVAVGVGMLIDRGRSVGTSSPPAQP